MVDLNSLVQGSEDWLEWRKDKISAGIASVLMGVSPWQTLEQLYLEKVGLSQPQPKNWAMQRGLDLEPAARKAFEVYIDDDVFPELRVHRKYDWMVASLDGVSLDSSIVVEIKCPGKKDHDTALSGKIPEKYYPQLQHQIEVCGVDSMWYFSYRSDEDHVAIKVDRCQHYCAELLERASMFYAYFKHQVKPVSGLFPKLDELIERVENGEI
jgi:putative phage-type endonuclease